MKEQKPDSSGALVHIIKVAEQLGLSEYQARGLVEKGELPAAKVGRPIRLLSLVDERISIAAPEEVAAMTAARRQAPSRRSTPS